MQPTQCYCPSEDSGFAGRESKGTGGVHGRVAQRGRVAAGSHPCPGGEEQGTGGGTRKKGMEGIGGKGGVGGWGEGGRGEVWE